MMIRSLQLLTFGLGLLLILGNFQCEGNDGYPYPFLLRDWQAVWIDNSGQDPVVAPGPIPRNAFGIRLSARMSNDGLDTLEYQDSNESYLEAGHPLEKIQVFTLNAFDTLAAGADISGRFRLRSKLFSTLEYYKLDDANTVYNYPFDMLDGYLLDLLMVEPPNQAGSFQFAIKIKFLDQAMPLNPDTLFNLPTVQLQ